MITALRFSRRPGMKASSRKRAHSILLSAVAGAAIGHTFLASAAWAQSQQVVIDAPNRKHLYQEDTREEERRRKQAVSAIIRDDKAAADQVDVQAGKAEFLKETNQIKGTEGVIISRQGLQVQAEQALVNMDTKETELQGKIAVSDNKGVMSAESGTMNLDSETGTFADAQFSIEEGSYVVDADEVKKLSDVEYELLDAQISTCQCGEDDKPWSIHTERAHITQEGYAHTYNTWMDFHGVPVFYTPYLAFPVKSERTSGLLAGNYGYSSNDGVSLKLPVYIVLGDSADLTVSPFLEAKTRYGSVFDYRRAVSRYNRIRSRILYSNDSMRDGDLRGTVTTGIFDPSFNENRFGGYYGQQWTSSPEEENSWAFIADVHYVNDNLVLREFDDDIIGLYNSRYATSTVLGRAAIGDLGLAEILGEYNQALVSDQDLTFQRLPETRVSLLKSFRPFGSNPFGLKLTTQGSFTATNFTRSTGYDGWRFDALPRVGVPFHVKNYVNGQFDVAFDATQYNLDDTSIPGSTEELDDSENRTLHAFNYRMSSGVERVFQLDEGNWLTWLTSLGQKNQQNRLVRLKHTVEPFMNYSYIPDKDQSNLPIFDGLDRVRARSLVTYGFRTTLLGRFLPRRPGEDVIPELTPEVEDLPLIGSTKPLSDLDSVEDLDLFGSDVAIRPGEIRPLVSFGMKQSYDYEQRDQDNADEGIEIRPLSDLNSDITLYPSRNFALRFENNYSTQDQLFTSWASSLHFLDDRGDALRARYSFVGGDANNPESGVSQLEANAEVSVSQRLKLGYYARYDNREKEFLERQYGMRLYSDCDCWHMDVGFSDKVNPDRQFFNISFTFAGLGDVAQKIGYGKSQN